MSSQEDVLPRKATSIVPPSLLVKSRTRNSNGFRKTSEPLSKDAPSEKYLTRKSISIGVTSAVALATAMTPRRIRAIRMIPKFARDAISPSKIVSACLKTSTKQSEQKAPNSTSVGKGVSLLYKLSNCKRLYY